MGFVRFTAFIFVLGLATDSFAEFGPQDPYGQQQNGGQQFGPPQMSQPQFGQQPNGPNQFGQPQFGPPQQGQNAYGQPQLGQPQFGPGQPGQPQFGQGQPGQPQFGQPQFGQPQQGQGPFGPPGSNGFAGGGNQFGGPGAQPGFPGNGMQPQGNNQNAPQNDQDLTVPYVPPAPEIIEESRVAADHLMRHAGEMLYSCNRIRANRFIVNQSVVDAASQKGYTRLLVNDLLVGANAPAPTGVKGKDVGYAVCWWIDELRLRASYVLEGIVLSRIAQDRRPEDFKQIMSSLFAQVRSMNIAAHEAVATSYFYVAALHKTCVTDRTDDSNFNCPGNPKNLLFDLAALEGKAYAVRNLVDNMRRYSNLKPGFPALGCVECTFGSYRYFVGKTDRQEFIPYPFYPFPRDAKGGNPYAIYQSKQLYSAPGIRPQPDDGNVRRYSGTVWQQAWDVYDLRYVNPTSPIATYRNGTTAIGGTVVPAQPEGVNGLPATNALAFPVGNAAQSAPPGAGQPDGVAPPPPMGAGDPRLDNEPVPFGDVEPTQPTIRD
jgi:hypothetical protein